MRCPVACLVLAVACSPSAVHGWALDYRLDLRAEHSSNVARRNPAVDDRILSPRLAFALAENGERLTIGAAADIEKRLYDRSGFADETLARLGLRGNWVLLEQRLAFAFEDALSDQPVNSFLADAPDNRQRVHVWNAGPTLTLRPAPRARLVVELRGGASDAERNREFNADRSALAVRGLVELGPRSTLSAHAEAGEVDFSADSGGNADYRRSAGFLRVDRRLDGGDWSLDTGLSRLQFERNALRPARRTQQPLLRLRVGVELDPATRLDLRLQRQFSDTAQDVLDAAPTPEQFEQRVAAANLRSAVVSADVFAERGASLALSHAAQSWSLAVVGYLREQRYESSGALDQDVAGASLALARQLRPRHQLGLFAAQERRDYLAPGRDDRDNRLGLTWTWQRTRRLALGLELSRTERQSSDPAQRFDDDRVLVTLSLRR
jgi:hypothetical protein